MFNIIIFLSVIKILYPDFNSFSKKTFKAIGSNYVGGIPGQERGAVGEHHEHQDISDHQRQAPAVAQGVAGSAASGWL